MRKSSRAPGAWRRARWPCVPREVALRAEVALRVDRLRWPCVRTVRGSPACGPLEVALRADALENRACLSLCKATLSSGSKQGSSPRRRSWPHPPRSKLTKSPWKHLPAFRERNFFIDTQLVRIRVVTEMILADRPHAMGVRIPEMILANRPHAMGDDFGGPASRHGSSNSRDDSSEPASRHGR